MQSYYKETKEKQIQTEDKYIFHYRTGKMFPYSRQKLGQAYCHKLENKKTKVKLPEL